MKLDINAPDPYLVERYLEEIARAYDIKWRSSILQHEEEQDMSEEEDDNQSDGGGQAEVKKKSILVRSCYLLCL